MNASYKLTNVEADPISRRPIAGAPVVNLYSGQYEDVRAEVGRRLLALAAGWGTGRPRTIVTIAGVATDQWLVNTVTPSTADDEPDWMFTSLLAVVPVVPAVDSAHVALEMVSRLAASALQALDEGDKPDLAFRLVEAITGVVADRLATDVKDQDRSDAIATAARAALGPIREHAERDADRDREEAAILAETERFMAAHGAKTVICRRTDDDSEM